jgi:DNA-binding response OmpR family regulator
MSAMETTQWRFLIVEDEQDIADQIKEAIPTWVTHPETATSIHRKSFADAMDLLPNQTFDALILDLKDDSDSSLDEHDVSAGMKIFESLKTIRFCPVIFYTAHAHKVRPLENSFVRIVEKTEGLPKLEVEVANILATKLPRLTRQIEELQRNYMWNFVNEHWAKFGEKEANEQVDVAYLLARRLALELQFAARSLANSVAEESTPADGSAKIHPMEMYIRPPISGKRLAGDILQGSVKGVDGAWIILTPSCDFQQTKNLHNVLLAQCVPLTDAKEFTDWKAAPTATEKIRSLMRDNRANSQAERFKFLPGTFFFRDAVVDFQKLVTITPEELKTLSVVASLDSPFAEAVLARFARYAGRLGTPDIDTELVLKRLSTDGNRPAPVTSSAPSKP